MSAAPEQATPWSASDALARHALLTELLARYGGDELAIVMPGASLRVARGVAERLRKRIETERMPHPTSPIATHVTVSIGIATAKPRAEASPLRLVAAADAALYGAKQAGRNRTATKRDRGGPSVPIA